MVANLHPGHARWDSTFNQDVFIPVSVPVAGYDV